jgi:acetylornithine/succinyldiaminopimelate/putrescine aminotransferase
VGEKARGFRERLRHPLIRSFRQAGLLMALEFGDADINQRIIRRCIEKGLLTDWFLFAPECLRLAPPLTISEEEVGEACRLILEACDEELAASEAQPEASE